MVGGNPAHIEREQLRGLALMCTALLVLSVLALVTVDHRHATPVHETGTLTAAGDFDVTGPGAGVPPSVAPLFPTTTTTRPGKNTASTLVVPTTRGSSAGAIGAPAIGTYTYAVQGDEAMSGFGTRALPVALTLSTRRAGTADARQFDLFFSDQHKESMLATFSGDMVALRVSTMTVSFGPVTRTYAASYSPSIGRVAFPLAANADRAGASEARDSSNQRLRVEDWKATDVAPRTLTIAGVATSVWEIGIQRTSRAGASEPLQETGKAWFDPARRMWVKWETHLHIERKDTVASTYDLNYTATLTNFTAS